ncbi:hypothetical protein RO3G_06696 [Rhizopus delemar RA 99-880]|uniref:Uncharacterized protein n=1 Tax=Rhizopus delemar (strain RA 99-880 / ATCC MYA-4621 / FGSC 9543 / NRRL 43880) TaxID=246409 RepID=I1C0L1_RHIO9|nr:hypothetical protein RO3G_06696 [Rhizopus delemar RA 99-880]|eukprot:EIE81991.1 hypothetical protein RO3G_06696 [Rhizopus delemar RA 99-880]
MTHQPQAMEGVTELGRDAFNPIPSVPADWQWSTF